MTADTSVSGLVDGRAMNWQFVLPAAPDGMLALAEPHTCPPAARRVPRGELIGHRRASGWPAIAVPDVGARIGGGDAACAAGLIGILAAQVAPGGWLGFGVANSWYPGSPRGRRSLGLGALRRVLRDNGLSIEALYVALPDHRHPAVLAAASPRAALDEVLRRLPTTYVPAGSRWSRVHRAMRTVLAGAAAMAPHVLRMRLAPAYVVVARRPS